jgi:hypothetical protein
MALYWPPKAENRIPLNLGSQFATLGANVLAFINNLGPNNKPQMLKVGPKFFGPWLLSVKRAFYMMKSVMGLLLQAIQSFFFFPCLLQ